MQRARSNFVTFPGLALLFILAVVSVCLKTGPLFAVLTALFLLCLISRLWADASLKKIKISTGTDELSGFPGDSISLPVTITNDKMIPVIWLSVALDIGEDSCIKAQSDARPSFSWMMPHQTLSWSESFAALKRGVCRVSAVDAVSGDGFGLAETEMPQALERPLDIYVFPSLLPLNISAILRKLTELEASSKGFYTDPTLLKTVTPYTQTESFKDLNWRILARQGELVVNKKEKLDALRMCLVIDLESVSYEEITENPSGSSVMHRVKKERLEHMLSVAASIVDAASECGASCSVVLPSYEGREVEIVISERPSEQTVPALKALACVDYQGGRAELPFDDILSGYHSLGQLFCLTDSAADSAERMAGLDEGLWYISAVEEGMEHVIAEAEILR